MNGDIQSGLTSHAKVMAGVINMHVVSGIFLTIMSSVILKSEKKIEKTPVQEIWHNDGDQILAYTRGDLLFVFNFNPSQSFTDYGFIVKQGAYDVVLNTDNKAFGGNGLADDSVRHFTNYDPIYEQDNKGWLKLYIPARSAVVLRKAKEE